jgi:hypothetical protein
LHIGCQQNSEKVIYEGRKIVALDLRGRKRGKNSRILREFTTSDAVVFEHPRNHDCFLSRVPSPFFDPQGDFLRSK